MTFKASHGLAPNSPPRLHLNLWFLYPKHWLKPLTTGLLQYDGLFVQKVLLPLPLLLLPI